MTVSENGTFLFLFQFRQCGTVIYSRTSTYGVPLVKRTRQPLQPFIHMRCAGKTQDALLPAQRSSAQCGARVCLSLGSGRASGVKAR